METSVFHIDRAALFFFFLLLAQNASSGAFFRSQCNAARKLYDGYKACLVTRNFYARRLKFRVNYRGLSMVCIQ